MDIYWLGCCWGALSTPDYPWCFYKDTRDCGSYKVTSSSGSLEFEDFLSISLSFEGLACGYYDTDVPELVVEVTEYSDDILNVKIIDPQNNRWEVPEDLISRKRKNLKGS